jgi:hypothetical protein
MSEWCQNKKCPEKKNQNQIRGSKGAKYYQSNKSSSITNIGVAWVVVTLGGLNIKILVYKQ